MKKTSKSPNVQKSKRCHAGVGLRPSCPDSQWLRLEKYSFWLVCFLLRPPYMGALRVSFRPSPAESFSGHHNIHNIAGARIWLRKCNQRKAAIDFAKIHLRVFANGVSALSSDRTPRAFKPSAQGCREAATLGKLSIDYENPDGVLASDELRAASEIWRRIRRSVGVRLAATPVGVGTIAAFLPRVVRHGGQPWALSRGPLWGLWISH